MSATRYYYDQLVEADSAWMESIKATYPKEWPGDVRYTDRGKGDPGSPLRAAFDEYRAATAAFQAAGGFAALQAPKQKEET